MQFLSDQLTIALCNRMQRRSHIETNGGDEGDEVEKEGHVDKVIAAIRRMNQ
jgi:hypothetical protein